MYKDDFPVGADCEGCGGGVEDCGTDGGYCGGAQVQGVGYGCSGDRVVGATELLKLAERMYDVADGFVKCELVHGI